MQQQVGTMILVILLVLCLATGGFSGWLMYRIADQAVTIEHQSSQLELNAMKLELLLSIVNNKNNISKEYIYNFLKVHPEKYSYFEKDNDHLVINQISFFFAQTSSFSITIC